MCSMPMYFRSPIYPRRLGLHWAQRSPIVTITSHILQLAQIQAQKLMLLDPNIWSNYFMLLGPIHDP